MAEFTSQLVLVRCPKCRLLLPELPDFQLYKCGGCGAILQEREKAELVPSELHSPITQVQRAREEDECGGCGAILKGLEKAELVPSELHSPLNRCDFKLDFDSVFSVPMYSPSNFFYKVNPVELSVLENGISHAEYFRAVNGELDGASESTIKHLSLTYDDINEMTFGIIPKYKDLRTLLLLSGLGSSIKRVTGDLFLSLNF
ncbi:hypothetical protein M0R45_015789 [Rubus argutus]|uniref:Enhanced disease resistance 4-like N-terminal domain-containing protein n=1 Tax=Rubus argutus TaxID=59490 RepID=A0AAW1XQL3_RUBAR